MPHYIINRNQQSNGDYEVHDKQAGCKYMPNTENEIDLGWHSSCHGAVAFAKQKLPYKKINGCFYCCNACHTS